jgi:hypothetical protein
VIDAGQHHADDQSCASSEDDFKSCCSSDEDKHQTVPPLSGEEIDVRDSALAAQSQVQSGNASSSQREKSGSIGKSDEKEDLETLLMTLETSN